LEYGHVDDWKIISGRVLGSTFSFEKSSGMQRMSENLIREG
jgi:hypothetical protein